MERRPPHLLWGAVWPNQQREASSPGQVYKTGVLPLLPNLASRPGKPPPRPLYKRPGEREGEPAPAHICMEPVALLPHLAAFLLSP